MAECAPVYPVSSSPASPSLRLVQRSVSSPASSSNEGSSPPWNIPPSRTAANSTLDCRSRIGRRLSRSCVIRRRDCPRIFSRRFANRLGPSGSSSRAILPEPHRRPQKCQPQAVRRLRTGRKLRLEKRRDEEAMVGQFHGACFAADPSRAHAQARRLKLPFVFLVHAVVAVVLFGSIHASADRSKPCAGKNRQSFVAGAAGTAGAPVGEGAGKRGDDLMRG